SPAPLPLVPVVPAPPVAVPPVAPPAPPMPPVEVPPVAPAPPRPPFPFPPAPPRPPSPSPAPSSLDPHAKSADTAIATNAPPSARCLTDLDFMTISFSCRGHHIPRRRALRQSSRARRGRADGSAPVRKRRSSRLTGHFGSDGTE